MKLLLLGLLGLTSLAPAPQDASGVPPLPVFRIVERQGTIFFVAANRSGVSTWSVLRELEALGALRLAYDVPQLAEHLQSASVNLAFERMEATEVARLACVVAGLDLVPDAQTAGTDETQGPQVPLCTVVNPPDNSTLSGRDRLRTLALDWYDRVAYGVLPEDFGGAKRQARVRFERALLLKQLGDFAAAADEYGSFAALQPDDPYAPQARFNQALCFFETREYERARILAHRVMVDEEQDEYGLRAAVLLGRTYLELARSKLGAAAERPPEEREGLRIEAELMLQRCASDLALSMNGFRGRDGMQRLHLVMAEVHWLRGHFEGVFDQLRQLEHVIEPVRLDPPEWAMHFLLSGVAHGHAGDPLEAEARLWQFLQRFPEHRFVPSAWTEMAHVQWKLDDPLQTLFAARRAGLRSADLVPVERDRLVLLHAQALLALGQVDGRDGAIELLRREIYRRGPGQCPELEVFVAQMLLSLTRPELAKAVLAFVVDRRDAFGETARVLQLRALAAQEQWEPLVLFALENAELVADPRRQAEVSELVGDAYTALGRPELAAEAYAGRIR